MQHALEQYNEKRTTMAESIKQVKELDYPILVFCPEPGFKPSFFRKRKWNHPPGAEKFMEVLRVHQIVRECIVFS